MAPSAHGSRASRPRPLRPLGPVLRVRLLSGPMPSAPAAPSVACPEFICSTALDPSALAAPSATRPEFVCPTALSPALSGHVPWALRSAVAVSAVTTALHADRSWAAAIWPRPVPQARDPATSLAGPGAPDRSLYHCSPACFTKPTPDLRRDPCLTRPLGAWALSGRLPSGAVFSRMVLSGAVPPPGWSPLPGGLPSGASPLGGPPRRFPRGAPPGGPPTRSPPGAFPPTRSPPGALPRRFPPQAVSSRWSPKQEASPRVDPHVEGHVLFHPPC